MRTRSRILAFVLTVLMVVGMLPLSVFALGDSEQKTTVQTREEWLAANKNVTMLFGTSFDDESKFATSGDGTIKADAGMGEGSIQRTNMSSNGYVIKPEFGGGYLHMTSPATGDADVWSKAIMKTPASKLGENVVFESTMKFNKHFYEGTGIFGFQEYNVNSSIKDGRVDFNALFYVKISDTVGGFSLTSKKEDVIYTFELGTEVRFAAVVDTRTYGIHLYIYNENGEAEYAGSGAMSDGRGTTVAYNTVEAKNKYMTFGEIRLLQLTNKKNQDFEIHDFYVYAGTDTPYATKKGEVKNTIGQFLADNNGKLLGYYDGEGQNFNTKGYNQDGTDAGVFYNEGKLVANTESGLGLVYQFNSKQYYLPTIYAAGGNTGLQVNAGKLADFSFIWDGYSDGYFLRMQSKTGITGNSNRDAYFDFYPGTGVVEGVNKFTAGDTYVVSADFRKGVESSATYTLFDMAIRNPGRNTIAAVRANPDGGIYIEGVQSAYNKEILGYLKSDRFTNVALIVNTKYNLFSVAIDGVVIIGDELFLSSDKVANLFGGDKTKAFPTEIRTSIAWHAQDLYKFDVDNYMIYSGAYNGTINAMNFFGYDCLATDIEPGWHQTDEGYWRYYNDDGIMLTGTHEIDGKTYYFGTTGYYSELQKDYLINFGNTANDSGKHKGMSGTLYNLEVHSSSWQSSALWADILKEGESGGAYGANQVGDIKPDNAMINPNIPTRILSVEEEKRVNNTETGTFKVFDFREYAAVEVDWYTDRPTDFAAYALFFTRNARNGIAYEWYTSSVSLKAVDTENPGWRTSYIDLTSGTNMVYGADTANAATFDAVWQLSFSAGWSSVNAGNNYTGASIYFGDISLVKYVPVQSDVAPNKLPTVRTVDGKTYIYKDVASEPNTGWFEYNGDTYYADDMGVVQTGLVTVGTYNYEFDDYGRYVGDATGVYVLNGKAYYIDNGVRKIGEFTYQGKTFSTKGDGEILGWDGAIQYNGPLTDANAYKASSLDPTAYLDDANLLFISHFNNRKTELDGSETPGGITGAMVGSANNNDLWVGLDDKKLVGNTNFLSRRNKLQFVKEADGNVALKYYNRTSTLDSYVESGFGGRVNTSFVYETSFKLGEDWNASGTLIQLQDRGTITDWSAPSASIGINAQGYVTCGGRILGKLSTTEYTTVSMVHNYTGVAQSTIDIYLNGIKVYVHNMNNANFLSPTMARMLQLNNSATDIVGHGTIYLDNIAAYKASAPKNAVDMTGLTLKNGLIEENGYLRYYENGAIFTGTKEVEGTTYNFNAVNGIADTQGFANDQYFINGVLQEYTGKVTIGFIDYYFDDNHKLVKNGVGIFTADKPGVLYTTDGYGVVIKTENRPAENKYSYGAGDLFNFNNNSTSALEFNASLGGSVYTMNKFMAEYNLIRFNEDPDLGGYNSLVFDMYVTEETVADATATFGIYVMADTEWYEITAEEYAANAGDLTGRTPSETTPEGLDWSNGIKTGFNGEGYLRAYTTTDGAKFYVRRYEYYSRDYNFNTLSAGWNTITVKIDNLVAGFEDRNIDCIKIITIGWSYDTYNKNIADNTPRYFTNAALIKGEPLEDATFTGWKNDRYFVNGELQTGWQTIDEKSYYLDAATGIKKVGVAIAPTLATTFAVAPAVPMTYYNFGTDGALVGIADGVAFDDVAWVYEGGKYVEKEVKRFVEDGALATGVLEDADGNKYYADPATYALVSNADIKVGDEIISTDENGKIVGRPNEWIEVEGNKYYYGADGKLASGYTEIENKYYFFNTDTNALVVSGWATVEDAQMFFGANGVRAEGVVENAALTVEGGYLDNTGYFEGGIGVDKILIFKAQDGVTYKYTFVGGKCQTKVELEKPQILLTTEKDGIKGEYVFFLDVTVDYVKVMEQFSCYTSKLYGINENDERVELDFTDNKLVIPANSTYYLMYVVVYTPIALDAHDWEAVGEPVAPNCKYDGYTNYVCKTCGLTKKDDITDATGVHEYNTLVQVVREATCSVKGEELYSCVCGDVQVVEIDINPDKHDFSNMKTVPATCYREGYSSGVCSWCNKLVEQTIIDRIPHAYGEWEILTEATCATLGLKKRICSVAECGHVEYSDIAYDYSNHLHGVNGTITHQSQTIVEGVAYFSLYKTITPSTCATPGEGVFRCLDCGTYVEKVVLNLNPDNHEMGDEYLVIFGVDGSIIETIKIIKKEDGFFYTVANGVETKLELGEEELKDQTVRRNAIIAASSYGCGYAGEWRSDCVSACTTCFHVEGETVTDIRYYEVRGNYAANGRHIYDLNKFYTSAVKENNALYGYHYNVCEKCDMKLNPQAHAHTAAGAFVAAAAGKHNIYCDAGCIDEATNEVFFEVEDCDYTLVATERDTVLGHVSKCDKCGYEDNNFAPHTIQKGFDETHHWELCTDGCGYLNKVTHTLVDHPAQNATCNQTGWDAYRSCDCGYESAHNTYPKLTHTYDLTKPYQTNEKGHWYACTQEGCDFKYLADAHNMVDITAKDADCVEDGNIAYKACEECGWYDKATYGEAIIPKLGHLVEGVPFQYNDTEHWQICQRPECGKAVNRDEHVRYAANEFVKDVNFKNYDDENGTALVKCKTCDHFEENNKLATWWGALGLKKDTENGTYYLEKDGAKVTDKVVLLPDGTYRYFDKDGNLVTDVTKLPVNTVIGVAAEFGNDGVTTQVITYNGYAGPKAAERGAIKTAILDTADGTVMIENYVLVGAEGIWKELPVDDYGNEKEWYFFQDGAIKLPAGTTLDANNEGTIEALDINGTNTILVNVRADGSRLLGVVKVGDNAYLYLDGVAGRRPAGWITDEYTAEHNVYYVKLDGTLANGKYVLTEGGVYWNFNNYVRADAYCRNEAFTDGETVIYINAEGKQAYNEVVYVATKDGTALDKCYYIKSENNVQSILTGVDFVISGGIYYAMDKETGVIAHTLNSEGNPVMATYTGWIDADSYSNNGIELKNAELVLNVEGSDVTYYFDGNGNYIKGVNLYVNPITVWSFDANGYRTTLETGWVCFLGEDGCILTREDGTEVLGYFFDYDRGLARGNLYENAIPGGSYIFDADGYLVVSVEKYEHTDGKFYIIDANGKVTIWTEEEGE